MVKNNAGIQMKKSIIILILALTLLITACGNGEDSGNNRTETPIEQVKTEPEIKHDSYEPEIEQDDESGIIADTPASRNSRRNTIAVSNTHIIGVKTDGTVVVRSTRIDFSISNSELSDWCDVVAVAAGQYISYGLKSDGTVLAVGHVMDINRGVSVYQDVPDLSNWNNIIDILAFQEYFYALQDDGTMLTNNVDNGISNWSDITDFDVNFSFIVGLRSDGSVVALNLNNNDPRNELRYVMFDAVSNWNDIMDIAVGRVRDLDYTIGLRSDGALLMASTYYVDGFMEDGTPRYEDGIVQREHTFDDGVFSDVISISSAGNYLYTLHSDGTVTSFAVNGTCRNVSAFDIIESQGKLAGYNDIVYLVGGVGVKSDGTVVYTDSSGDSIDDWYDIMIP